MIYFELVEDDSKKDDLITPVKAWIAHTGRNLNKSDFSKPILQDMIPSLANTPIVGFIEVDNKNKEDFKGHEERYIVTVDGVEVEYLGRMYGIIPESNNARFEMKTVDGVEREYLVADGIMFNKFSKAKEILDRDISKYQSMELDRKSFAGTYDKASDSFIVTKAKFEALCILGDTKRPAMVGGLIEKVNFSTARFEVTEMLASFKAEMLEQVQALRTEFMKGGRTLNVEKLKELLTEYAYISSDFALDLETKLDSYETEDALRQALEVENKTQFSLTVNAEATALNKAMDSLEIVEKRDWSYSRYSYRDHNVELGEVYGCDRNDYSDVGFKYLRTEDTVVIDVETRFDIVWQPRVKVGSDSSFEVSERNFGFAIDMSNMVSSYETEVETLTTQKTEFESTVKELQEKITQYESQLEELDSLRKHKEADEERMKAEFVESVENLTVDEKAVFTENIANYTLESIKEEVVKFVGQKAIKFSVNEEKPIEDKVAPIRYEADVNTKKPRAYETYDFSKKS
jgi:hypothetical protein